MKIRPAIIFVFTLLVICLVVINTPFLNNKLECIYFDLTNSNPSVNNEVELKKILITFERIPLKQLPDTYLKDSKMKEGKYANMVASMRFYKVNKKETYKKIIGNLRIVDFIAKDQQFSKASYRSSTPLYWGMNPNVLHKLLELKIIMEKRNLDFDAITINSGHRTPDKNEKVGGASKSRHIVGEAIDLKIGDVDQDGFVTAKDKNKILEICDLELIGNQGGVGKYPGTDVIHIDIRGHRARWDTY